MTHLLTRLLLAIGSIAATARAGADTPCSGTVLASTRSNNEIVCHDAEMNREIARFGAGPDADGLAWSAVAPG